MTGATPLGDDVAPSSGATKAPLSEGEEPEATPLERAKKGWDLVSDVFTPMNLLALVGLLIIGVIALFGGWGEATASAVEVPTVKPGETIKAAPFEVQVLRARHAVKAPPIAYGEKGYRYLFLVLKVQANLEEPVPSYVLASSFYLDAPGLRTYTSASGAQVPEFAKAYRLNDSLFTAKLQPGLPYEIVLVWQQSTSVSVPTTLNVAVFSHKFDPHSPTERADWVYDRQVARVTLDVSQVPES